MLKSSSKQHTVNMKLFLLTVVCLAAAFAAPAEKQKRDILPGDPRYGTDYHHQHHHHHHENEVHISRALGGYVGSYVVPDTEDKKNSLQVLPHTYGPPHHKPGPPLNNAYLSPVIDDVSKETIPVPSYGVPDVTSHAPQVSQSYLESTVEDVKKIAHTPVTSYGSPLHDVKTNVHVKSKDVEYDSSVETPVTSYGTPLVSDLKTTLKAENDDAHVESSHITTKVESTVIPSVHHEHKHIEETKTITKPELKVTSQTPVTQEIHHSVKGIKSIPEFGDLSLTGTGFGSHFGSGSFDSLTSNSGGFSQIAGLDTASYPKLETLSGYTSGLHYSPISSVPSSVYTGGHIPSYGSGIHGGYGGYDSVYGGGYGLGALKAVDHHVHLQVPQTYPVHFHSHVPYGVPLPQPLEAPKPYHYGVHQPLHVPVEHSVPSYPVHHYGETKTPVIHEHVPVEKTNPVSSFFQNNLPSFQNPLQNFQLPSFEVPSFPFLKPTTEAPLVEGPEHVPEHGGSTDSESVVVDNPAVKIGHVPTVTKTSHPVPSIKTTKEYTQPIDSNGGYIY